jgi:hypothetical protein
MQAAASSPGLFVGERLLWLSVFGYFQTKCVVAWATSIYEALQAWSLVMHGMSVYMCRTSRTYTGSASSTSWLDSIQVVHCGDALLALSTAEGGLPVYVCNNCVPITGESQQS